MSPYHNVLNPEFASAQKKIENINGMRGAPVGHRRSRFEITMPGTTSKSGEKAATRPAGVALRRPSMTTAERKSTPSIQSVMKQHTHREFCGK